MSQATGPCASIDELKIPAGDFILSPRQVCGGTGAGISAESATAVPSYVDKNNEKRHHSIFLVGCAKS